MKLEIAAFLLTMLPHARGASVARQPATPRNAASPRVALAPALDRPRSIELTASAPAGGRPKRPPPAPPLAPRIAAKRFVVWMQDHGFTGEKPWGGPSGIWAFYGWHCHEANVQPVPDNMFAAALEREVNRRQVRDRSSGKLRRFTYYLIPDLPEAPAARAMPRRRAA